jgi:hypothetical protein
VSTVLVTVSEYSSSSTVSVCSSSTVSVWYLSQVGLQACGGGGVQPFTLRARGAPCLDTRCWEEEGKRRRVRGGEEEDGREERSGRRAEQEQCSQRGLSEKQEGKRCGRKTHTPCFSPGQATHMKEGLAWHCPTLAHPWPLVWIHV